MENAMPEMVSAVSRRDISPLRTSVGYQLVLVRETQISYAHACMNNVFALSERQAAEHIQGQTRATMTRCDSPRTIVAPQNSCNSHA